MARFTLRTVAGAACAAAAAVLVGQASAAVPEHHPIYMPNVQNSASPALQPPPICCVPVAPPAAGEPAPVNMAYWGGHVEIAPKIYLVFWGWGQTGAFDHSTPGMPANDPDGAAAKMSAFIAAIGGTAWTESQTQYYQEVGGVQEYIGNPSNQLGGVWYDDANPSHDNLSGIAIAREAQRAVAHFGVTDLKNAQFVIAQPQKLNEKGFNDGAGYCAWHDYTQPSAYPGVQAGIAFTNMPYVLNMGGSCGENSVNSGAAGTLDGFTIVLGHEVEETVTDPGAESIVGGQTLGGWFDYSGYENGDKCAWVGSNGILPASTVPGGLNNITGNDGKQYAVQSLWSNASAAGAGYCAGAGDDLPTG